MKKKIKISEINEMAVKMVYPKYTKSYIERRNLILNFLKEKGIPVLGKR
jgi:hypothetical protein